MLSHSQLMGFGVSGPNILLDGIGGDSYILTATGAVAQSAQFNNMVAATSATQAADNTPVFTATLANGETVNLTRAQAQAIETLRTATPPVEGTFADLQAKADDVNTDPKIRQALLVVLGNNDCRHFLDSASTPKGQPIQLDDKVELKDFTAIASMPGWSAAVAPQDTSTTSATKVGSIHKLITSGLGTATPIFSTALANGEKISLTSAQVNAIGVLRNANPPVEGNFADLQKKLDDGTLTCSPEVKNALRTVLSSVACRDLIDSGMGIGGNAAHLDGVFSKEDLNAVANQLGWSPPAQDAAGQGQAQAKQTQDYLGQKYPANWNRMQILRSIDDPTSAEHIWLIQNGFRVM